MAAARARGARVRAELERRKARPVPPGAVRLSLVIPAFREEDRIAATVGRVRDELGPLVGAGDLEVVVVDDGSGDDTAGQARAAGADQVIVQPQNMGKGASVRAGMLAARGRTLAFTDADLAYAPAQVARLLAEVEDGWDVVVGNRHHAETTTVVEATMLRAIGHRVINAATRAVLAGGYGDTQCGLKAFRSDVAQILFGRAQVDGFAFDIELLAMVERFGLSLTEVPVEVENSELSTVKVARDSARLLADLARLRARAGRGAYDPAPGELDVLLPNSP